jgi:hypothetical protein
MRDRERGGNENNFFFVPVVVKVGERHGRGDVHTTLLLLLEVNPIYKRISMIKEVTYIRLYIYIYIY